MDEPVSYSDITPVRITAGGVMCSGVVIAADAQRHSSVESPLVLTCAHYFRNIKPHGYAVFSHDGIEHRWHRRVTAVRIIDGTDIAVLALSAPVTGPTPALVGATPGLAARVTTIGFGGRSTTARTRFGRFLLPLPWSRSREGLTHVRPAGLVYNSPKAIKGDSGGPVMYRGNVIATQALIFDPRGRNMGIATVNLLGPHLPALRRAMAALEHHTKSA